MSNANYICGGCGKRIDILQFDSPVIDDYLWQHVLDYYQISEERQGPQLPAMNPQYVCCECMEKAIGRKLRLNDLQPLPFNLYFKLHHFYKVSSYTVKHILRYMHRQFQNTPKSMPVPIQREVDFMNGVLMPFEDPECNGYITALLSLFNSDQLKCELIRRERISQSKCCDECDAFIISDKNDWGICRKDHRTHQCKDRCNYYK